MKSQHSLISPSNFERRMLCPGSLNAEKDLPEQTSVYAEEGTMLHERTAMLHQHMVECSFEKVNYNPYAEHKWSDGLSN